MPFARSQPPHDGSVAISNFELAAFICYGHAGNAILVSLWFYAGHDVGTHQLWACNSSACILTKEMRHTQYVKNDKKSFLDCKPWR